MIDITFYQDKNGDVNRMTFEGHAEFDDMGRDIVCASVSILFINTVNSIENITKDRFKLTEDKKKNVYDVRFEGHISDGTRILIESLKLGLYSIYDQYGKKYLRITLKEVQ